MPRKAPVLPSTFPGGCSAGGVGVGGDRGGSGSVRGGVSGVGGNVRGGGSVTGGAGSRAGGTVTGGAGRGVSRKGGGAYLTQRHLTTHPGARCVNGVPRSVVVRVRLLEIREYVLGAVGGPKHQ